MHSVKRAEAADRHELTAHRTANEEIRSRVEAPGSVSATDGIDPSTGTGATAGQDHGHDARDQPAVVGHRLDG